ncbi:hypothetical protein PG991_010657 [Apiospora marii]|uniref:Uncharacterized protein n=1 Tax=Apiospora marii TaxID=335849 RepID=A0ABR1RC39_9PEZI
MASSSAPRRVTFVTNVNAVHTGCWHIDNHATPIQRRVVRTLRPGEPEPAETVTTVSEAKTQGTCALCTTKLVESRQELKQARNDDWVRRLGEETDMGKAFRLFFTLEQQFLMQFMQNCKTAVLENQDTYHRRPLEKHTRQIRQLVLFGNELQREVAVNEKPNQQVVETVILEMGKSFLAGDVWQRTSESDFRDGLELAVPAIMTTVLAMRPGPNLAADVRGVMVTEFGKAGIY